MANKISSYQKLKLKIEKMDELLGRRQALLDPLNEEIRTLRKRNSELNVMVYKMVEQSLTDYIRIMDAKGCE